MQVPAVTFQVTVRSCIQGEVQPRNDSCMTCPPTTYSYTPTARQCISPCPANANCSGGASLVPNLGYWHSAPNSTYMAACPNAKACQGDRNALLACQDSAYAVVSSATSGESQVRAYLFRFELLFPLLLRRPSVTLGIAAFELLFSPLMSGSNHSHNAALLPLCSACLCLCTQYSPWTMSHFHVPLSTCVNTSDSLSTSPSSDAKSQCEEQNHVDDQCNHSRRQLPQIAHLSARLTARTQRHTCASSVVRVTMAPCVLSASG